VNVTLIQVPYHAGDDRHPSSAGPARVVGAGAVDLLEEQGHGVAVEIADRGTPFRDTASSTAAVNKRVAALVRRTLASNGLPIVVAGSCVTAQACLPASSTPPAAPSGSTRTLTSIRRTR
jgi:hypothetical protein